MTNTAAGEGGWTIERIVCGGQTGADRAALDAAISRGIDYGGWVPKGRLDECGIIPACYQNLKEADDARPETRTALNVRDSDATLILAHGPLQSGSAYTRDMARELGRPCCSVDLKQISLNDAVQAIGSWLDKVRPNVLNVAGPRASEDTLIYDDVIKIMESLVDCGA